MSLTRHFIRVSKDFQAVAPWAGCMFFSRFFTRRFVRGS